MARRTPVKRARILPAGRSKYGAIKTEVDGVVFASRKEARRFGELKLLEKARAIHGLVCQPRFPLTVLGTQSAAIGEYRGDFQYCQCVDEPCLLQARVVEDVKGFKTPLYKWKAKHMAAQYGIQIREI